MSPMKIKDKIKVLMLEDVVDDVAIIEYVLQKAGIEHETLQVDSKTEFIKGIKEFQPDLILSDHSLPQFNSIEAHKICLSENLHVPFILVTGAVSEEFAVTCLKHGIDDYILKSNLSRLPSAIASALKQRELEQMKIQAMQELKEQNEEILKINRELDSFIYSISHSLRGPLSTVSGLLNLAEIEESKRNSNVNELHQMMEACIKRLDTTIGQMVDQSKNARLDIDTDQIDIEAILDKSVKNLSYMSGFEFINISLINHTNNIPFYSDAYRLEVIFNNLLSNSIKYRDFSKEKTNITVHVTITSESVVINFQDNGLGIPEKLMHKVFNMFYRASERSDGAGLGLYIVKEFVEKLKGSVTISSIENESTIVTIVLPNVKKIIQ